MAVSSADIKLLKSTIGDSAGGGATATVITSNVKNNLFPDLSDAERAADGTRYRKVFVGNDNGSDSLIAPKIWFGPDVTGFVPSKIAIGFDDADDDTGLQGNMTAFGANALLELSSTAADTRNALVYGIDSATSEPATEVIILNGSTPVLGTITWSKVYGILLDAEHGTNVVTAKQGSGGTVRGTIGANLSACFLWITASSEATALWFPDVIAGQRLGVWIRQDWTAGVLPQRPTAPFLNLKEGL